MKILTNFYLHLIILGICAVVMIINVISTGANNVSEMTIIGKVAGYIFMADLVGFAFYVIILKMIFKVK